MLIFIVLPTGDEITTVTSVVTQTNEVNLISLVCGRADER
jgi:hypothetical protein